MREIATQIKDSARALGFDVIGITSVAPFARDDPFFRAWCEDGFAAGMDYMTRRPELNGNPGLLAPWAASLITFAVNYYTAAPAFNHENRYGRVARYAWGLDYHDVLKTGLRRIEARIEELAGKPVRSRSFVDAVPLLERAAAARAGIGFFGKNTNLLQVGRGSWFFLAELLVDLDLPAEDNQVGVSCGTCSRCLDVCPTKAFAGPYRLDSRLCISYLTIEHKGAIPRDLRKGLGEWVFGCDMCQEMRSDATNRGPLPPIIRGQSESVCPFNRFAKETTWPEFRAEAGVGPRLDLVDVLSTETDRAFRARFKDTPLARPKRRGLLRNAAVVAANIGCTASVPALIERIEHDPEPLIRSHSLWALSQLAPDKAARHIARSLSDQDPEVREEASVLRDG